MTRPSSAKGYGSSRPLLPNRDSKGDPIPDNQEINRRVIVTIGFSREIEDAIRAMKTNQFVSADAPELDAEKSRTALVRDGEGEPTWREKVVRDTQSVQEKLKLAEERLKETEERNRAAKNLAEMQKRLSVIERRIEHSETETQTLVKSVSRLPADSKSNPDPVRAPATTPKPAAARPVTPKPAVKPAPKPATAPGVAPAAATAPSTVLPAEKRAPATVDAELDAGVNVGAPVAPTAPVNSPAVVAPADIPIENLSN